jgi:hypothetical protein
MHLYRFRIATDAIDDFVREIDIAPSQTFEDFQKIILSSGPLRTDAQMVFYTTNIRWVRLREIGTEPVLSKPGFDDDDDVRVENRRMNIPFTHMSVARLRDFVEDPHQRMIFEYYGVDTYLFFVELVKIFQSEESTGYPKCVMSRGDVPVRPAQIIAEMQDRQRKKQEAVRVAQVNLEEVQDDAIEEEIEELLHDETFSSILAGVPVKEKPEPERPRKLTTKEIAEEFGPEFADMMEPDEEEEEEDMSDNEPMMDDDDEYSGGRSSGRGRGYDDLEY